MALTGVNYSFKKICSSLARAAILGWTERRRRELSNQGIPNDVIFSVRPMRRQKNWSNPLETGSS
jgi:hypothetical protein